MRKKSLTPVFVLSALTGCSNGPTLQASSMMEKTCYVATSFGRAADIKQAAAYYKTRVFPAAPGVADIIKDMKNAQAVKSPDQKQSEAKECADIYAQIRANNMR